MQWDLTRLPLQAARRTWGPKTLQNRGRNSKKSMSKNNRFSASIFSSFGLRFGEVFGRFFGADWRRHACAKKIVREAFRVVKTISERMWAFSRYEPICQKIDENSHVFRDVDFGSISGRFWECCGGPKPSVLAFFAMFFRSKF